jgi:cyanate permease
MRTIWATVLSVWALLAVVAFLAWTRQQPAPAGTSQSVPGAVLVKNKNGTTSLVVVSGAGSTATHATTKTSPVPAG